MAEALVFVVLQKIASAIGEEVLNAGTYDVREVQHNIIQIQMEFDVMQGFLRRVDVQAASDQCFISWLEHVRRVAYDVEDIIDEYAYLVGQKRSINSIVRKIIYHVKNAKTWHEIATRLKETKDHIDLLSKMRIRYDIIIPNGSTINRPNADLLMNVSDYSHLVDENEIVGNLEERNQYTGNRHLTQMSDCCCGITIPGGRKRKRPNVHLLLDVSDYSHLVIHEKDIVGNQEEWCRLIQWLTDDQYYHRAIISICGMGGLGKTTLVNAVYNNKEIKKEFQCCAYIFVSRNYLLEDLLRNILKQILESEEMTTRDFDRMDRGSLVKVIRNKLQQKRYLIVLDDVWRKDSWSTLSQAFPDNTKRSRVVITTRIDNVARLAHNNWSITMRTLSTEEAGELFTKKVFGNLKEKTCPQELVGWAEKIVNRCQGLPLAIVAIGSLLSFKDMNETTWRSFYHQLSWELSNNPEFSSVANVLNLSYDDLPTYLKNCFIYCSLLPKYFLIKRKWIIRLLIAEGFIEDRGPRITMEEVAESYLVELARRSLLEIVERNVYGRAKKFRMHDLVRDICIAKAKGEKFGIRWDDQLSPFDGKARRIFIHNMSEGLLPIVDSSKLRSLLLFQKEIPLCVIDNVLANLRLLRVLSLSRSNIESLPEVFFELFNLHYLDLSYTNVKAIPNSLGKLKLLQTLDLRDTSVEELPPQIICLTKLRHLFTKSYHDYQARKYFSFVGVELPPNICEFQDLQTLHCIKANDDLVLRLGNLVHLRNLFLLNVEANHIGNLWVSITKIRFLSALGIIACNKDEVLNLHNINPVPGLEKLYLKGKLEGGVIPAVFTSFTRLRELKLGWLGLKQDPLRSFSHMLNLVRLHLYRIYEGQSLTFCSGWFPKLQFLYLADLFELNCIKIENGAMENLQSVNLIGLSKLKHVPQGMRHLHAIKELNLTDMPGEFISNLEENGWEYLNRISSIPEYNCKILFQLPYQLYFVPNWLIGIGISIKEGKNVSSILSLQRGIYHV